jgi:hypothetical protein
MNARPARCTIMLSSVVGNYNYCSHLPCQTSGIKQLQLQQQQRLES